ncbi:MAG: ATP-dependent helicase [Anaerolineaceae bacterium]|nr:ATP-dependent helicase [Anaerolineaceae bacterium]
MPETKNKKHFLPRPDQQKALEYKGGEMGISAVPGSGKTHTLSALAANLVEKLLMSQQGDYDPKKEILIVTFSNSAAENFSRRIYSFLLDRHLPPNLGYRVSTLHALALDIILGHETNELKVVDEANAGILMNDSIRQWIDEDKRKTFDKISNRGMSKRTLDGFYATKWEKTLRDIMPNVVSRIKDCLLSPEELRGRISSVEDEFGRAVLEMSCGIYEIYQKKLKNFPGRDFSDMITEACLILKNDPGYLEMLQDRWLYILEDEAQDSSPSQTEILKMLSAKSGNWVRVGDPNQSINGSFTTANPDILRNFIKNVNNVPLEYSGRSQYYVQNLANGLINYCTKKQESVIGGSLTGPYMKEVPEGGTQKNPERNAARVGFDPAPYDKMSEIKTVCKRAVEYIRCHRQETVAILVSDKYVGSYYAEEIAKSKEDVIEFFNGSKKTQDTAKLISSVLKMLDDPSNYINMDELFGKMFNEERKGEYYLSTVNQRACRETMNTLMMSDNSIFSPVNFIFPDSENEVKQKIKNKNLQSEAYRALFVFRRLVRRWLGVRNLTTEQMIISIGQDLFTNTEDLALTSQIAKIMADEQHMKPELDLKDIAISVNNISKTKLYSGIEASDGSYDPEKCKGKIVLINYHKAKGLEWDQVFLTGCNNRNFPSGSAEERTACNRTPFVFGNFYLESEIQQALKSLISGEQDGEYVPGEGTALYWDNYVQEKMRLLYVCITRAKKGIYISWNNGDNDPNIKPAEVIGEYLFRESTKKC